MRNQKTIVQLIVFLLILLFVYTATSKLIDLKEFEKQLGKQHIYPSLATVLLWAIPVSEILTALLLAFKKTKLMGLCCSLFMLILFTAYIGLALIGFYKEVPCSCGGVLKQISWKVHFWFNIFFLFITSIGIWIEKKMPN
jgi:putative oxidoreductase